MIIRPVSLLKVKRYRQVISPLRPPQEKHHGTLPEAKVCFQGQKKGGKGNNKRSNFHVVERLSARSYSLKGNLANSSDQQLRRTGFSARTPTMRLARGVHCASVCADPPPLASPHSTTCTCETKTNDWRRTASWASRRFFVVSNVLAFSRALS